MISDTLTLTRRSLRISFRNLDTVLVAAFIPVMMLLCFVMLFGGGMEMGREAYVNLVVPGALILSAGYSASLTAQNVQADMKTGIIDRFRSMPVAHSSFLAAHVLSSLVRSGVSMLFSMVTALLLGFRPQGGASGWLILIGTLVLYLLVITWISIFIGLIAKTPESAGSFGMVLLFLPYISTGFVDTSTLYAPLRIFAENQPLSHICDTVRNAALGISVGNELWLSLIWCAGLLLLGYALSMMAFRRKKRA